MNYSSKTISRYLLVLLFVLLIGLLFNLISTYFELSSGFQIWLLTIIIIIMSFILALFTFYKGGKIGWKVWARLISSITAACTTIALGLVMMWYFLFYKGGEAEFYIPQWICSKEARQVIQEFDIQKVHSCKTENTKFRNRDAKLVSIQYNLAACFKKCVYNFRQAIVQDGQIIEIVPAVSK